MMRSSHSFLAALTAAALLFSPSAAVAGDGNAKGKGKESSWEGGHTCEDGKKCQGKGHTEHGNGNGYGHNHGGEIEFPDVFPIERPGNDRGAFVTQIGENNEAAITQTASTQFGLIGQVGADNRATVDQSGTGAHYGVAGQLGGDNDLMLTQSGSAAQVALLKQVGGENAMTVIQHGDSIGNGIAALQLGRENEMSLTQSGNNNQALLVQNGTGNEMTAVQTGGDNQLIWMQEGDNLSHQVVTQNGSQSMHITQSRW